MVSSQTVQKGNIPWRIPEAAVLTALESFLILSDLVVPVVFTGGCAHLYIIVTKSLDLQDANSLFFRVLKIYRTPRCLLEADKQMETRGGLYSSIIPYFL